MESATFSDPPPADAARHGTLVGYDVAGFTRYVAAATERHGERAGEFAASVLVRGEQAVAALLAAEGFERIDAIGDGAVFLAQGSLAEARRRARPWGWGRPGRRGRGGGGPAHAPGAAPRGGGRRGPPRGGGGRAFALRAGACWPNTGGAAGPPNSIKEPTHKIQ